MKTKVSVEQTVQQGGNALVVRIVAPVTKAAGLACGVTVKVEVVDGGVFRRTIDKPELTLAQMLKAFDPASHGGEVMATGRYGAEVF